jgi:hypothetical protein
LIEENKKNPKIKIFIGKTSEKVEAKIFMLEKLPGKILETAAF